MSHDRCILVTSHVDQPWTTAVADILWIVAVLVCLGVLLWLFARSVLAD